MPIRVYLLQEHFAVAAGTTIIANVKKYGQLPAAIQDDYGLWSQAHTELDSALEGKTNARDIDPHLDRAIAGPARVCDAIIGAYSDASPLDARQQQQLADATLVRGLFDADLSKVVSIGFTEEWAVVRQILQRVSSDKTVAAAVERLALGPLLALATTYHEDYGRALGVSVDSRTGGDDTRLATWNSTFADLIVAARYLSKKNPGLYEVFAEPYEEQLARQQAAKAPPKSPKAAPKKPA